MAFHVIMAAVEVGLLVAARRRPPRPGDVVVGLAAAGLAGAGLAAVLGEGPFGILRLLAYGLFVHGPILLAGAAATLRVTDRRWAWVSGLAAVGLAIVAVDAFLVEPTWLEVSHVRLESGRVDRPLRIVVLADIQTDRVGPYERDVLRRAMAERPDLVLMPGDYIQVLDPRQALPQIEALSALLVETGVRARLGAYAVQGNVDGPGWTTVFVPIGARTFEATERVDLPEVSVTGLSFADSFDTGLTVAPSDRFHIVFGHGPDFALGHVDADLLVAGHTHGGQVRLPFVGPLMTLSRVPRAWAAGVTDLGGGRTLVVSRGIGMERGYAPRLRFLCRPEVVVIDVVPAG